MKKRYFPPVVPKKRRRIKPVKPGGAYRQLWRVVDGAILDCMIHHPDYFSGSRQERMLTIRRSLAKRVVGAVMGYAEQSAKGRSGGSSGGCSSESPA